MDRDYDAYKIRLNVQIITTNATYSGTIYYYADFK